jgi:PKD repeat protein
VCDDDGACDTDTVDITITNVAPTADAGAPQTDDEGDAVTLTPTYTDPGADTHTGTIDWGDNTSTSLAAGATHTYADNGNYTVTVDVCDDDGACDTDTVDITITNVAPTVGSLAVDTPVGTVCATGTEVRVRFVVADPADETHDAITGTIDWGDGASTPVSGRAVDVTHSYGAGRFTMTVAVDDGDGGAATLQHPVALLYRVSEFLAPLNSTGTSNYKVGRTIPAKVQVADCNGAPVDGLTLTVGLTLLGESSGAENEAVVSSVPDDGNTMRFADAHYIYNLATKRSALNHGDDLPPGRYRLSVVGVQIPTRTVEFDLVR